MWIKLPWDADNTVSQWTPVVGACAMVAAAILHQQPMSHVNQLAEKSHIPEGFTFADDARGAARSIFDVLFVCELPPPAGSSSIFLLPSHLFI